MSAIRNSTRTPILPPATSDYLANGAAKGSRNSSLFDAACQLRDAGWSQPDAARKLRDRAMRDGLEEGEANRTIANAFAGAKRDPVMPKNGNGDRIFPNTTYSLAGPKPLPQPIEDSSRTFLKAVFRAGELINICQGEKAKDTRETPSGSGVTLILEDWLERLDSVKGEFDKIMWSPDCGVFVCINPLKEASRKSSNVAVYRHVLVEFDGGTFQDQWSEINRLQLPCAAVLHSGGKSIHCWVRIDAKTAEEYKDRVSKLFAYLEKEVSGVKLDGKTKDPCRYSRLPGAKRGDRRQELLAVSFGEKSWLDWAILIQQQELPEPTKISDLLAFDPTKDPANVIGKRWLCRGGSCLLIGSTGIGKSVVCMQAACSWAIGIDFMGLEPNNPLRSLIIQSENDLGDLAEMWQGIRDYLFQNRCQGLGIDDLDQLDAIMAQNLVIVRNTTWTGVKFTEKAKSLIEKHKPDLVWVDPLMSFFGGDLSDQETCSRFLRNHLNPISEETGIIWMIIHHSPKPIADPKSGSHFSLQDLAYKGFGSSELANWPRAIISLSSVKHDSNNLFCMSFPKRMTRTGIGTHEVWLEHSENRIAWRVSSNRPEPKNKPKNQGPNIAQIIEEKNAGASLRELSNRHGIPKSTLQRFINEYDD